MQGGVLRLNEDNDEEGLFAERTSEAQKGVSRGNERRDVNGAARARVELARHSVFTSSCSCARAVQPSVSPGTLNPDQGSRAPGLGRRPVPLLLEPLDRRPHDLLPQPVPGRPARQTLEQRVVERDGVGAEEVDGDGGGDGDVGGDGRVGGLEEGGPAFEVLLGKGVVSKGHQSAERGLKTRATTGARASIARARGTPSDCRATRSRAGERSHAPCRWHPLQPLQC